MKEPDYEKLHNSPLFASLATDELKEFVKNSGAYCRDYARGGVIIREGENTDRMGVLVSGRCTGESVSEDGRRESVAHIEPGEVFGDILAMDKDAKSPVTVYADTESIVLFIPFANMLSGACSVNARFLANLLGIVSQKYFALQFRASCISKPTLRGKISAYLHGMRREKGGAKFTVPLDRAELADFLNCDRSALCRELSAMRAEGLIDYRKNRFEILSSLNTEGKL